MHNTPEIRYSISGDGGDRGLTFGDAGLETNGKSPAGRPVQVRFRVLLASPSWDDVEYRSEMAVRTTLKAVNAELARSGHHVLLTKGAGYFYFHTGEAADWLDRTVRVETLNALTLEQWVAEFERLKKRNQQIVGKAAYPKPVKRKAAK